MKTLKRYMILGAIFVSVLGTILHFAYEWSENSFFLGLFVPINESIWEHTKLLFFPMLIFSFYASKRLKKEFSCIDSGLSFGILLGTFLIPILFYTYSGALGFNIAAFDIAIFYISVFFAFFAAYKLALSCKMEKYDTLLSFLLILMTFLFIIFTIIPPNISLFMAP